MRKVKFKFTEFFLTVAISVLAIFFIVNAGNLNPSSTPGDTMKTLDDIYYKLQTSGSAGTYGLNPPGSPASTMHTLQQIYDAAPDFNSQPGNATTGDVCNSKTFYTNSATRLTGNRTACQSCTAGSADTTEIERSYTADIDCDGTAETGDWVGIPDTGQINPNSNNPPNYPEDANSDSSNSWTCGPSYVDNSDGTITDTCTKLMWEKCTFNLTGSYCNTGNAITYDWKGAIQICDELNLAGHTDWRLPNVKELQSIVHYGATGPSIYQNYFNNTLDQYYWSATYFDADSNYAWHVDFYDGIVNTSSIDTYNYVRCVRP